MRTVLRFMLVVGILLITIIGCVNDTINIQKQVIDGAINYVICVLNDTIACMRVTPDNPMEITWEMWKECSGQALLKNLNITVKRLDGVKSISPPVRAYAVDKIERMVN